MHPVAMKEIRQYRRIAVNNRAGLELRAFVDFEVRELKRYLAQTGGRPIGARRLWADDDPNSDGTFEFEYVSDSIWVTYSRERMSRNETLITILRWSFKPYSDE
jgi:hypothetical protein